MADFDATRAALDARARAWPRRTRPLAAARERRARLEARARRAPTRSATRHAGRLAARLDERARARKPSCDAQQARERSWRGRARRAFATFADPPRRRSRSSTTAIADPAAARAAGDALQASPTGRGARRALGAHLSRRLLGRHVRADAVRHRARERAALLDRDLGGRRRRGAASAPPGATWSPATAPAAPRGSSSSPAPCMRAKPGEGRARRRRAGDRHRRAARRATSRRRCGVTGRRRGARTATRPSSTPPRQALAASPASIGADALIAPIPPANFDGAPRRRRRAPTSASTSLARAAARQRRRQDALVDARAARRRAARPLRRASATRADASCSKRRASRSRAAAWPAPIPSAPADEQLQHDARRRPGGARRACAGWSTSTARSRSAWASGSRSIAARVDLTRRSTRARARPAPGRRRRRGARELEELLDAPPLRPHRPRARAAGHADQQHRGRDGRLQPRRRRRRSFDALHGAAAALRRRPTGRSAATAQWLAELLGHRRRASSTACRTPRGTDSAEARAMNRALWPATLRLLRWRR